MPSSIAERAERFVRYRSIMAVVLSIILIVTQGQRMDGGGGPLNWALWSAAVALFLIWASGLLAAPALRGIANDETTDAHRKRSIAIGFWAMTATAMTCFILTYFKSYGPRDAIQVIMTTGFSASLLSFGISERVAARA